MVDLFVCDWPRSFAIVLMKCEVSLQSQRLSLGDADRCRVFGEKLTFKGSVWLVVAILAVHISVVLFFPLRQRCLVCRLISDATNLICCASTMRGVTGEHVNE